jgi:hypothetical protein
MRFVYKEKININKKNVESLIKMNNLLKIESLKLKIEDYV